MRRIDYYRLICSILCLSENRADGDRICEILQTKQLNWYRIIEIASNHLVLPSIYVKLKEADLLKEIPELVVEHLQEVYELNLQRNESILIQVESINKILNSKGLEPLYIKGVANIINGLYIDKGERIMLDIDFMLPKNEVHIANSCLQLEAYMPNLENEYIHHKHPVHLPRLSADGQPASVEIHSEAVGLKHSEVLNCKQIQSNKLYNSAYPGCSLISTQDGQLLNFLHSQIHHQGHLHGKILLRNLYEFYLFSLRDSPINITERSKKYKSQAVAYLRVLRQDFKMNYHFTGRSRILGHGFFLTNRMNIRYRSFSLAVEICIRVVKSYILLPIKAFTNKKLMKSILARLTNPNWYKQHFASYKKGNKS